MEPLLFGLLVAWAFTRYGITDLIATMRGTESARRRERAQRSRQRHEQAMAAINNGRGPTIAEAVASRIANRGQNGTKAGQTGTAGGARSAGAKGPARRFFADMWTDSWDDATERRRGYRDRRKRGDLPRQRAWKATKTAAANRWTRLKDRVGWPVDAIPEPAQPVAANQPAAANQQSAPSQQSAYGAAGRQHGAPSASTSPETPPRSSGPNMDNLPPGVAAELASRIAMAGSTSTSQQATEPGASDRYPDAIDAEVIGVEIAESKPEHGACGHASVDQPPADEPASPPVPDHSSEQGAQSMSNDASDLASGETLDPQAALGFTEGITNLATELTNRVETSIGNLADRNVSGEPMDQLRQLQDAAQQLVGNAEAAAAHFRNHVAIQDVAQSDDTVGDGNYLGINR